MDFLTFWGDKMKNRVAVYDMDGTIVCSKHRYRTKINEQGKEVIDLLHWQAHAHKAYSDSLLPLAEQYKRDLQDSQCYVIIATARVLGEEDMRFIRDKLGIPDKIISRPAGSDESGASLKVKGLKPLRSLKQFRDAAWTFYEDNLAYLTAVCNSLNIKGVFVPSQQGH